MAPNSTIKEHTMKKLFLTLIGLLAGMALAIGAQAATPNYNLNAQEQVIPFQIGGQYTATTAGVVKFTLPYPVKLVGVSATARASGGTTPTLTVDVKEGGTTVLSAPVSVTAGTVSEGTITDATLADEASMTVDLAIGGTTPTWNDITVLLTVVRR
jgi:hypothetical protein